MTAAININRNTFNLEDVHGRKSILHVRSNGFKSASGHDHLPGWQVRLSTLIKPNDQTVMDANSWAQPMISKKLDWVKPTLFFQLGSSSRSMGRRLAKKGTFKLSLQLSSTISPLSISRAKQAWGNVIRLGCPPQLISLQNMRIITFTSSSSSRVDAMSV